MNARLIIGDGRVIERGTIVIDSNGRIAAVGPATDIIPSSGATPVDAGGKTIMPALVDAHVHVGYENMQTWRAENYTPSNIVDTLDRLAYYGIGAVFSTGSDPTDEALQIQRDQAAGRIEGARFVFAVGFGPPGQGPNDQLLKELAKFPGPVVRGITGDADARQAVRDIAARGIGFAKVWVTDRNGTQRKTAPEAYRALIDEAHKNNIRVVAHVTDTLEDAKDLARAGLDGSLHSVLDADAEFAGMMKRNGAFLAPTQGFGLRGAIAGEPRWYEDPFFQEATPDATIARYRRQAAAAAPPANTSTLAERLARPARMMKVLLDGGVRIVIGTDAGAGPDYPLGYPTHREMELYTRIGMTADQVIVAATSAGAEAIGLGREMGTLEAGKRASLIVLDADPRTDIANTRKISRVYLNGREIERAAMRKRWKTEAAN